MKIKYLLPVILIALAGFCIQCKKKDYRDTYTGNWTFVYDKTDCSVAGQPCTTLHGQYNGSVSYDKHDDKHNLSVDYSEEKNAVFVVDESGNITLCGYAGSFTSNKTISFVWNNSMSCGSGHTMESYTVTGTKN